MTSPVLSTKLFIPPPRPKTVLRPRLIEGINEGLHRKLTLICAPAGFGKTTLVSEWSAGCGRPIAWVSLDSSDNDPLRFIRCFISALQTIIPHIGRGITGILDSPSPPPVETILSALVNELAVIDKKTILVMDDYHLIESHEVDQILAFLIEHLPPKVHLVITTREDPNLPVARMRARDQVTELRASDLSFNLSEAGEFLNDVMKLNLKQEDIASLENRTEGWITGLQLAAISLRGQKEPGEFIRGFSGSHHFVLDYLIEEVIKQQESHIQSFLLCTSILERMCGPLCDELMENPAGTGQKKLEYLEQANLFVIPLDSERRWYRYHHLFADLLRQRLHQIPPVLSSMSMEMTEKEIVSELHIRASHWFEDNGLEVEAFQHAASSGDLDLAERLVNGRGMPLYLQGATSPLLRWLESLPQSTLDSRPSLWVTFGAATMISGHPSQAESKLHNAEVLLPKNTDDKKNRDLIGQIAAFRTLIAASKNDIKTIMAESKRALDLLDPQNQAIRIITQFSLGVAFELQNDRGAAIRIFQDVFTSTFASGNRMLCLASLSSLAGLLIMENRLREAADLYNRFKEIVNDPEDWLMYDPLYGLARIAYERNDLDTALRHADACIRLAPQIECGTVVSASIIRARIYMAGGNYQNAAAALSEAEEFAHTRSLTERTSEVETARVDFLISQGNLHAAAGILENYDLPMEKARLLISQGQPDAARVILQNLRTQWRSEDRPTDLLRCTVRLAVACYACGDVDTALNLLEESQQMTEADGFIRLYVDEGVLMEQLLSIGENQGKYSAYSTRLLEAIRLEKNKNTHIQSSSPDTMIEILTSRELDVLRLISQGLSNQEIAAKLFLALSTVKGHSRVIYDKLQVQRRTEAVAKAREIGII